MTTEYVRKVALWSTHFIADAKLSSVNAPLIRRFRSVCLRRDSWFLSTQSFPTPKGFEVLWCLPANLITLLIMKVTLKRRNGVFLGIVDLDDDMTVEEFKDYFYREFHYYPERQRWTIEGVSSVVLEGGTLEENGIKDSSTLLFKDLGVQISWRLVFVLEYVGPLIIFPIIYYFPNFIYNTRITPRFLVQKVGFFLALFHFTKRELETLFVHRFSHATMPIIRVPINCGHYWLLFGVGVGYYLYHPQYLPAWLDEDFVGINLLAAAIIVLELLNFKTHLILRNLRPRGTKKRGIPSGWGFDQVSSANYMWEIGIWILFSILVNTVTAWLFTIVAFIQMASWAKKKAAAYEKEFDDYPRNRKAIIPLIL